MIVSLSDLLHSVRIVHADFALVTLRPGGGIRLCDRDHIQLHLVIAGEAGFAFPRSDQQLRLGQGQYLFAPPGTEHEVSSVPSPDPRALASFFMPEAADQAGRFEYGEGQICGELLSCAIELDRTRHESLLRLLPEIQAYRRRKGPTLFAAEPLLRVSEIKRLAAASGASAFLSRLVELLLVHAMRESLVGGASPGTGIATPDSPQIAAALRLIYEHPEHDWSVGGLAREVGMSRSVFATAFAERLHETPIRYVTRVRMLRAEGLLKDGSRSLAQIAHLIGYESEAAFARAFKREFDKTPGAYRRETRLARSRGEASPTLHARSAGGDRTD
jgi:AraC-like DNA-binding protein